MRTHSEIIKDQGSDAIQAVTGVSIHTVRSWAQRKSIPSQYWKALADAGHTTLDELATAVALDAAHQDAAA